MGNPMRMNKQASSGLLTLAFLLVLTTATTAFGQDNTASVPNGFDEQDLRSAQGLQVTDALAQKNEARVAAAEEDARMLVDRKRKKPFSLKMLKRSPMRL